MSALSPGKMWRCRNESCGFEIDSQLAKGFQYCPICQTPALSDANNEEKQQESDICKQQESDPSTAVNTNRDSLIDDGEGRNQVDSITRNRSSIVPAGNSFDENFDADFELVDKAEALPIVIHRERSVKDSELSGPGFTERKKVTTQVYIK